MRKGFFFSTDALLAGLVLIGGLVLIASISQHSDDTTQIESVSDDLLSSLESLRVYELRDNETQELIKNGTITNENSTVLEQIGYFWALGETARAQHLADVLLNMSGQPYGVRLTIENDVLFDRPSASGNNDVVVASRMITGIAEGKAITGSSASAYLRRIKDKRTSSFTVFGGFVGQGNLSMRFGNLPTDANITDIRLELAAAAPFRVYFNGNLCGGVRTPSVGNGTPDYWDLTSCNTSITPGSVNTIGFNFTQPLNVSYIAGGFLRIKYKTKEPGNISTSFVQYRFPGINGVVNLYDAFYVPGTLTNMTIYLHYSAENSTYVRIGEKKVWNDTPAGAIRTITLNDTYLRDPLGGSLDYDFLSNKTVPIRMVGFEPNETTIVGRDADVVIITDYSGSMMKSVSNWENGNLGENCNSEGEGAGLYSSVTIRRTRLAQCLDKVLISAVMNYSGIRVWPIFIHSDEVKRYDNPSDETAIKGHVDSYANGKDKTCYACALNKAYETFDTFSDPSRPKFIVFMTDGVPTHCPDGGCTSTSAEYGTEYCAGLCDQQGQQECSAADRATQCAACTTNNEGQGAAYTAATRLAVDFNATIYTVGFGPVTDCSIAGTTLQQIADIGNGTYQHSNDSSELKEIYENISQEILGKTTLSSQTIISEGNASKSRLYDDSHINITYELASQYIPVQNTISLTLQTPQACNPVLELFDEQQLIEAQAISYSGKYWTDFVLVNSVEVYNLSAFFLPYDELGDPTLVNAPISLFHNGTNPFIIETGNSSTQRTGCYQNNSIIYTVLVNLSTERSVVVPEADGCKWEVQFEDDTFENITIPSTYAGTNNCSYTAASIAYNASDAYQLGAYQIFNRLDFRHSGKLFVNLNEEDLEVIVTTISGVPYLWGPVFARLEVSR